ncbi:MAG TPA: GNAT family N-acetyltransferase [Ktedonobacterales bacterium]|nr:GNAT family N-acetyltransferase [Ktedonobacterales bacterium]
MSQYRTLIPIFDELRGERVIVRPYRVEDAEALRAAVQESRDHLRPWLPFADEHQSVEESRDFIIRSMAKWLLRENFTLSIWDSATGAFLGGTGFHIHDWELRFFEVGYWLRASAEGHGYMTEAVRLLADFLFVQLGAQRVQIRCNALNTRSAAVAQRLGFIQEARLRNERLAPDGSVSDTLIFSLIPSDPRWPTSGTPQQS